MFNTLCRLSQSVAPFKRMERRTARTNTYYLDYFASFAPLISRLSDNVSQMSRRESCSREELQEKWTELQLPMEQLETLLSLGNFGPDISWMAFFAHACTALGGVRNTEQIQLNWQLMQLRGFATGGRSCFAVRAFLNLLQAGLGLIIILSVFV